MASAQVVETSVNTNNSPSQDYTTNPDDHLNHSEDLYGKLTAIGFVNEAHARISFWFKGSSKVKLCFFVFE